RGADRIFPVPVEQRGIGHEPPAFGLGDAAFLARDLLPFGPFLAAGGRLDAVEPRESPPWGARGRIGLPPELSLILHRSPLSTLLPIMVQNGNRSIVQAAAWPALSPSALATPRLRCRCLAALLGDVAGRRGRQNLAREDPSGGPAEPIEQGPRVIA